MVVSTTMASACVSCCPPKPVAPFAFRGPRSPALGRASGSSFGWKSALPRVHRRSCERVRGARQPGGLRSGATSAPSQRPAGFAFVSPDWPSPLPLSLSRRTHPTASSRGPNALASVEDKRGRSIGMVRCRRTFGSACVLNPGARSAAKSCSAPSRGRLLIAASIWTDVAAHPVHTRCSQLAEGHDGARPEQKEGAERQGPPQDGRQVGLAVAAAAGPAPDSTARRRTRPAEATLSPRRQGTRYPACRQIAS